ncbi:DUF397 domain-containing protein [Actinomadura fulvescens]|uniref:DUF397 domain-containing protein n=1 Tax=Actinomadura fulvescens TaxID=46160 RepID=A0ABN3PC78_9ACTN
MTPAWRKSSHSGSDAGQSDCVEVAKLSRNIGVRDSKIPDAGHLTFSVDDFANLIARAKQGEFSD